MEKKSPKELIDCFKFKDNIQSKVNSFDSRKHLFDFEMKSGLILRAGQKPSVPTLKKEYHRRQSKGVFKVNVESLDINLKEGTTKPNKETKNFDNSRKEKWIQFLRCLQMRGTIAAEEPTFVTLSPIITGLFGVEEWDSTFFALKFNGFFNFKSDD